MALDMSNVVTFEELKSKGNEILRENDLAEFTDKELADLEVWHIGITTRIKKDAEHCDQPSVYWANWRFAGGYQMIAEGSVDDKAKQLDFREMNFHGMNTSRSVSMWGFMFDTETREFSKHT